MSSRKKTAIEGLSYSLAPSHIEIASLEMELLDSKQRNILHDLCDEPPIIGVMLATLDLVHQEIKRKRISLDDLKLRFPDIRSNATFSNWWSEGRIKSEHFFILVAQPEFVHLKPTPELALDHEFRQILFRVNVEVLSKTKTKRLSPWELAAISRFHRIYAETTNEAIDRLRKDATARAEMTTHRLSTEKMVQMIEDHGTAYRLSTIAMGEINARTA